MTASLLSLALLAGFMVDHVDYGLDARQKLDITRPQDAKAQPVSIFLHGGVWQQGDHTQVAHVGLAFAARGFVTVTASYRLAPQHRWPAQIEDAAAILALVKEKATSWGGDPEKIFIVGHSAGAQLALVLLYDPQPLQRYQLSARDISGIVALSGVFDLRAPLDEHQADGGRARFVTPVFGADLSTLQAASPIAIAKKTGTPLLFITSNADYSAMRKQSALMAAAVGRLGEKAAVVVVDGPDHFQLVSHIGQPGDAVTDEVIQFLRR